MAGRFGDTYNIGNYESDDDFKKRKSTLSQEDFTQSLLSDDFDHTINYGSNYGTMRRDSIPSSVRLGDLEDIRYQYDTPIQMAKKKKSCIGKGCEEMTKKLKKVAAKLRNKTRKNRSDSQVYDEIRNDQLGGFHLYKELGLRKKASIKQVKRKYRKIKKAYKTLSNKKKRLKYHMKYRKTKKKKRRRIKTRRKRGRGYGKVKRDKKGNPIPQKPKPKGNFQSNPSSLAAAPNKQSSNYESSKPKKGGRKTRSRKRFRK